jgi:segregation and condensation protein A
VSYKVKLEIFEGPLDLLLYLVKQNHLEITAIPMARITDQYLKTLELMQVLDLEIAGEFLVMAATLMQIKSRMLLPPEEMPPEEAEEPDPTQELIQRLLEYQRFKQAADLLGKMEKERMLQFSRPLPSGEAFPEPEELLEASLFDLLTAFSQFMAGEVPRDLVHELIQDEFTVEEKVGLLRGLLLKGGGLSFTEIFQAAKSKLEMIATFLALLELIRLREAVVRQTQMFGEIVILRNSERLLNMGRERS